MGTRSRLLFLCPATPAFKTCSTVPSRRSVVVQHATVKLAALGFIHVTMLQGLQVKADGSDRGLEFVGDRVDEAIVLLVAANLAQQENRIENQPRRDGAEEDYAQENFDAFAPVEDDPAESDRDCDAGEADA